MQMRLTLPSYNGKDYAVLAMGLLPFTVIVNWILFGGRYFTEWHIFAVATPFTALLLALDFIVCGGIAVYFKHRLPHEEQTRLRLLLMIICFLVASGIFLLSVFHIYELFPSFQYQFNEPSFIWAYVCMALINIFLTLLMEGIARYNVWRDNLIEAEKLNKTFQQTRLMALRSQVNPHFLFNSLNTLSSLIQEDEQEAEAFLNEMSKVYRYMLRSDTELLVPLSMELKFMDSYTHLLRRRFGAGIQVETTVAEHDLNKQVPHLSLHVVVDNAFSQNSMTRQSPLVVKITSRDGTMLEVCNNRQPKIIAKGLEVESGLDNLVAKYKLLNSAPVSITDAAGHRCVQLPLLPQKGGLS